MKLQIAAIITQHNGVTNTVTHNGEFHSTDEVGNAPQWFEWPEVWTDEDMWLHAVAVSEIEGYCKVAFYNIGQEPMIRHADGKWEVIEERSA
jgi:hypothetical protein